MKYDTELLILSIMSELDFIYAQCDSEHQTQSLSILIPIKLLDYLKKKTFK